MKALINIDVPELNAATAFYAAAFGLKVTRRIGQGVVELSGLGADLYLLEKPEGSPALSGGRAPRSYARHWTPVHLDLVVEDVEAARDRALAAGATVERDVVDAPYGRIAMMADPFGHGFCLIEFRGRGYDEPG
jgi:predicted enzyme related to lactoylglutathione lyase